MRIVGFSDTHSQHWNVRVPDGDVLIFAGDYSREGTYDELQDFNHFLGTLPHKHKIFIAGNHDFVFENSVETAKSILTNATYLLDDLVDIDGIKFYGSPWTPQFQHWAFMLPRGSRELKRKWFNIPDETEILITHGPMFGTADIAYGSHLGCASLQGRVLALRKLKHHFFGHIHEGYGSYGKHHNVSFCSGGVGNPPIVVDI